MRIEIVKGFLSAHECAELNTWAFDGVSKGWLDTGISFDGPTRARLTSRMYGHRYSNPAFALDVAARVRDFCGVSHLPYISGHGRDGIVVSCTYPGGDVYSHRDPRGADDMATLRCNIVTHSADVGGQLYVGGQHVSTNVGDLHCYLASEFDHYVTKVEGTNPRVLWMFGAHVNADDWESGRITLGE